MSTAPAIAWPPDLILQNGRITTQDAKQPEVAAVAVTKGVISAIGNDADILKLAGNKTQKINLNGRRWDAGCGCGVQARRETSIHKGTVK